MHKSTQQLCLDAPVYTASPHVPQSQGHSAKAASVLCISSHTMGSCSITVMESHPVGHFALYGQHGGRVERTGNTLESDVHFL